MRIADPHHARFGGAFEVIGHDSQSAARRIVGLGIERQHDRRAARRRVHGHDDTRGEHVPDERHELLGDAPEHDARIGFRIDLRQLEDALRRIEEHAALHGQAEESLLGVDVAKDRGRGDAELAGDVGQRGGVEALRGEDAAGGVDQAVFRDGRRAAHL